MFGPLPPVRKQMAVLISLPPGVLPSVTKTSMVLKRTLSTMAMAMAARCQSTSLFCQIQHYLSDYYFYFYIYLAKAYEIIFTTVNRTR
jgi:hypothetical protein